MNHSSVICWGKSGDLHSHRWIWQAFVRAASKLGVSARIVEDHPSSRAFLRPGTLCFVIDIWSEHIGPAVAGVDYVLHNVSGDHELVVTATPEQLLRLQVWTHDAYGEEWDPFRQYDREGRVLFQPWGSNLLAEEFLDPVCNKQSQEVVFVGAVWSDIRDGVELGNETLIRDLRAASGEHGLRFRHLTQISDEENVAAVRSARLAPALAGAWQVEHGYLPCRAFKNVSYGQLGLSNVPELRELLGAASYDWAGLEVGRLIAGALELNRADYLGIVDAQQRIVRQRYTYRESIAAIERALEEGR